jgi:hypothetical protein
MEYSLNLFTKVQYGIALVTAVLLLVNWLRPKVARLRAALAAKALAATESVADAALPDPTVGRATID